MERVTTSSGSSESLHVAYVGPIDFPSSSAPAQRMMGIIRALVAAGDRVSVGSAGHREQDGVAFDDSRLDVASLGELPESGWPKLRRVTRGLTWGAATRNWILSMDPTPDVILVYGTSLGYLGRLIPLARRMSIPLVIDATEWYESRHLPGGIWGPFALANTLSMRSFAPKADGVIAISSFLENYFERQGVTTIRVPPLFDLESSAAPAAIQGSPLSLCYVGSPGQKDRQTLLNLVHLPGKLGFHRNQLRIDIVGIDKSGARRLLGDSAADAIEHRSIAFHGRVTSAVARQVVGASNFSVLQRGDERYAQAGYPSKVPESLLLGTPVIANLSSDLANVLEDGKNAILLADASLEALVSKVSQLLALPYGFDRAAIAADAKAIFSPVHYAQRIHDFLVSLRVSGSRR